MDARRYPVAGTEDLYIEVTGVEADTRLTVFRPLQSDLPADPDDPQGPRREDRVTATALDLREARAVGRALERVAITEDGWPPHGLRLVGSHCAHVADTGDGAGA